MAQASECMHARTEGTKQALIAREQDKHKPKRKGGRYWPWAKLMARTFAVDVEQCPKCQCRMKLIALVQEPKSIARFLRHVGEPYAPPARAPPRPPPYYKTAVIRRLNLGDHAA